ncbi:hypothetical protein [Phyllobacterium endophyticum]|uniref:Glycine-rich cell wall protein n=1 Tax=Phyllobacterium endophyticum TaxID=1149773 RepID=A0A2P7AUX4_9HYPH|nr:hypothetical protein [Phyllobacterium endophyticum]MBB3234491.1 hypothetical protein [Phyllobacterium endophyticum]PSH57987.1 hypothetical protein CU100_09955 [Phyllobacterium endophyticum]TYR38654.1 hypothetical protein FY050_21920 [Phyllobacterium endophyticum]
MVTTLARIRIIPALGNVTIVLGLVMAPINITFDGDVLRLQLQAALAKDNGGGNGGGNAGGNAGNGGGNSGSNSGSGNSGGKGANGKGANAGKKGNTGVVGQPGTLESRPIEVRHVNGMSERIKDGRYLMRDAKGRTIINRTATRSDETRLQSLTR